jgi:hypothetical protein
MMTEHIMTNQEKNLIKLLEKARAEIRHLNREKNNLLAAIDLWTHDENPFDNVDQWDDKSTGDQIIERALNLLKTNQSHTMGSFLTTVLGVDSLGSKGLFESTVSLKLWQEQYEKGYRNDFFNIEPGDVVVLGKANSKWGDHVGIAVTGPQDTENGTIIYTIEPDARGRGEFGEPKQGVVNNIRPIAKEGMPSNTYRVLWFIRFSAENH